VQKPKRQLLVTFEGGIMEVFVFVVERECDDPYYGYALVEIFASEEEAKKVSEELTDEYYRYRYRKMPVLGS
jgi:hypothetical protein